LVKSTGEIVIGQIAIGQIAVGQIAIGQIAIERRRLGPNEGKQQY
jgi:hypothetical protein